MMVHLLLTALYGYFCHFTYLLTSRLSVGWSQLSAYTVGVLFVLPALVVVHRDLADIREPSKRLVTSYLVTFLAFGVGTAVGWVLHPVDGPHVAMMDDAGIR